MGTPQWPTSSPIVWKFPQKTLKRNYGVAEYLIKPPKLIKSSFVLFSSIKLHPDKDRPARIPLGCATSLPRALYTFTIPVAPVHFSVQTILGRWLIRDITRSPRGNEQEAVDETLWTFVQSRTGVRLCKLWPGKWSGENLPVALPPPPPHPLDSCVRPCVRVLCNRVARQLPNWARGYRSVPRRFGKVVKLGGNSCHPDGLSIC